MKLKSIGTLAVVVLASSLLMMGASGGCGSNLHKASVAADSIANSLNTAATLNHQMIVSGQETSTEGALIAQYLNAAAEANDTFITQISSAEKSGGQINAATIVNAFGAVSANLQTLQSQGVLGLKSPQAQATFEGVIAALNAQLAVLRALIPPATSSSHNRGAPWRHNAPLLGITLTATEIEELISIATAALGAGVPLVQKLLSMKGETDAQLLTDAQAEDALAEKQAQADEAKPTS